MLAHINSISVKIKKKQNTYRELVSLTKYSCKSTRKISNPQQKKRITKETQMILKCKNSVLFVIHNYKSKLL